MFLCRDDVHADRTHGVWGSTPCASEPKRRATYCGCLVRVRGRGAHPMPSPDTEQGPPDGASWGPAAEKGEAQPAERHGALSFGPVFFSPPSLPLHPRRERSGEGLRSASNLGATAVAFRHGAVVHEAVASCWLPATTPAATHSHRWELAPFRTAVANSFSAFFFFLCDHVSTCFVSFLFYVVGFLGQRSIGEPR